MIGGIAAVFITFRITEMVIEREKIKAGRRIRELEMRLGHGDEYITFENLEKLMKDMYKEIGSDTQKLISDSEQRMLDTINEKELSTQQYFADQLDEVMERLEEMEKVVNEKCLGISFDEVIRE